jgi:hypothetical protein
MGTLAMVRQTLGKENMSRIWKAKLTETKKGETDEEHSHQFSLTSR